MRHEEQNYCADALAAPPAWRSKTKISYIRGIDGIKHSASVGKSRFPRHVCSRQVLAICSSLRSTRADQSIALRWEKAHGYGSCSGLAKQQYPGRKTFTPEIAITPPPSTPLPGYMKETLSDAISRKQAQQQPAQGPSADRLAPPPVRIPTEGRPPVAQGKGKGKSE